MRTSNGCWTCRLRRKKCDETHPICEGCAALSLTCHFDLDNRPPWMDGGARQAERAEKLKQEIKGIVKRRSQRRNNTSAQVSPDHDSELLELPPDPTTAMIPQAQAGHQVDSLKGADAALFMFYIEKLLPFLFPFYRPSLLEGGKAWILEMMLRRPVVRQVVLCQSFYFSLPRGTATSDAAWQEVNARTQDAFRILRKALQFIEGLNITDHLHGGVRILASILQLQRFEIAVLSFKSWQTHLNAALALFGQLLEAASLPGPDSPSSRFAALMARLGPLPSVEATFTMLTSEQAALRFSAALLLYDDVISSTSLQEAPRLYHSHQSLLGGDEPAVNVEAVTGVNNRILMAIGEIAALDAWKQQISVRGRLDILELERRAAAISNMLQLEIDATDLTAGLGELNTPSDVFEPYTCPLSAVPANVGSTVAHVWAHAALAYLYVVACGWQLENTHVRHHVDQIVELLDLKTFSPPALLRTMVWPYFVAGCLAEPAQETKFRAMALALHRNVCGTVVKALEIMEHVWRHRDTIVESRSLSMCLRSLGDLPLLV